MGYVHSWSRKHSFKAASWQKIAIDSHKLINAFGRDNLRDIEIADTPICFVGDGEMFLLEKSADMSHARY
jgi:hypothetical protein